jgi:SAM-dependent methyltransferase
VPAVDWIYPFPPPPDNLVQHVGGGDYLDIGRSLSEQMVDAGLAPDHTILDVGCGAGRLATPLTGYLSARGSFFGFDVHEPSITWCIKNISSHFPNFRFTAHDIRHPYYNPKGAISPLEFRFPYDDSSTDFVSLWSVFTHLQLPELRHYCAEIHRVLRPGGKVLLTCFLLTPERERSREKSDFYRSMGPVRSGIKAVEPQLPEKAIAFEKNMFIGEVQQQGFQLCGLEFGIWCGTATNTFLGYQDRLLLDSV